MKLTTSAIGAVVGGIVGGAAGYFVSRKVEKAREDVVLVSPNCSALDAEKSNNENNEEENTVSDDEAKEND